MGVWVFCFIRRLGFLVFGFCFFTGGLGGGGLGATLTRSSEQHSRAEVEVQGCLGRLPVSQGDRVTDYGQL